MKVIANFFCLILYGLIILGVWIPSSKSGTVFNQEYFGYDEVKVYLQYLIHGNFSTFADHQYSKYLLGALTMTFSTRIKSSFNAQFQVFGADQKNASHFVFLFVISLFFVVFDRQNEYMHRLDYQVVHVR